MEPAGTGDGVESVRVERNHLARISTDAHVARVRAFYSFIFDLLVDYMYVLDVELRVRALGETTNDAFLDFHIETSILCRHLGTPRAPFGDRACQCQARARKPKMELQELKKHRGPNHAPVHLVVWCPGPPSWFPTSLPPSRRRVGRCRSQQP